MEDSDGRTVHRFQLPPGQEGLAFQVLDQEIAWQEVPGADGELEWREVRVIKDLKLISAGPVQRAPWPGCVPHVELVSITCPVCGRVSYNPGDVEHRYCGNCHQFHDQMPGGSQ
jgi:hypothetical protein